MKKVLYSGLLLLALLLMAGCAAGPNDFQGSPDEEGDVAGFWNGLWHGIISPIAFIVSLFTDDVNIYDVHNNGGWYNFGFMIGIMVIFGGSGGGAGAGRRKRRA